MFHMKHPLSSFLSWASVCECLKCPYPFRIRGAILLLLKWLLLVMMYVY